MKKFTVLFLIIVCFSFSMARETLAANTFKEGVYKLSDFNITSANVFSVQNISESHTVFVQVFDDNQLVIQSIRLNPKSSKYALLPLNPNYRIVFIGNGEVYVS